MTFNSYNVTIFFALNNGSMQSHAPGVADTRLYLSNPLRMVKGFMATPCIGDLYLLLFLSHIGGNNTWHVTQVLFGRSPDA